MSTHPDAHAHPHHHEPELPDIPGKQPVEPDEGAVPPADPEQDGAAEPLS